MGTALDDLPGGQDEAAGRRLDLHLGLLGEGHHSACGLGVGHHEDLELAQELRASTVIEFA